MGGADAPHVGAVAPRVVGGERGEGESSCTTVHVGRGNRIPRERRREDRGKGWRKGSDWPRSDPWIQIPSRQMSWWNGQWHPCLDHEHHHPHANFPRINQRHRRNQRMERPSEDPTPQQNRPCVYGRKYGDTHWPIEMIRMDNIKQHGSNNGISHPNGQREQECQCKGAISHGVLIQTNADSQPMSKTMVDLRHWCKTRGTSEKTHF